MTRDIAALMALGPSPRDLSEMEAAAHYVRAGIRRSARGWQVDADVARVVGGRDPGAVRSEMGRQLRILRTARAALAGRVAA